MGRHKKSLGIDFGTTTSFLAERRGDNPSDILPIGRAFAFLPSLGGYDSLELLIAEETERLPIAHVLRSVKRAITQDCEFLETDSGTSVTADTLIVALLSEVRRRGEAAGADFNRAEVRLGCPAMWTGTQRARLLRCAEAAGLPVESSSMIDEPIAAGVSWINHRYLTRGETRRGRLLVFDMGGGTLDIAVLDVEGGARPEISVLSAVGVDQAGDELDQRLVESAVEGYADLGVHLQDGKDSVLGMALLKLAMREIKVRLSKEDEVVLRLAPPFDALPPQTFSRVRLEDAFGPQMDLAEEFIWAALRQAKLVELDQSDPSALRGIKKADLIGDVDFILLAGGMSQIPFVFDRLGKLFPNVEIFADCGATPAEAIVAGLTDNTTYEHLNLHRPGFDFVLEWEAASGEVSEVTLYHGHTPFYDFGDAFTKNDLSYRKKIDARITPPRGEGLLRARSMSGEWLDFSVDGTPCPGVAVRFGHKDVQLIMATNGRFTLCDGLGEVRAARVSGWPVIRGREHKPIQLRTLEHSVAPMPTPWYWDKEFAGLPLSRTYTTAYW